MIRWGKTKAGSIRWFCGTCKVSGTRKRKDNRERMRLFLFVHWLTSKDTLTDIGNDVGVTIQTLWRWFEPLWEHPPSSLPLPDTRILVLDGTSVVPRRLMLLIAGDEKARQPVSWMPVERESHASWNAFLVRLKGDGLAPDFVVCDGQRGLLKAIRATWPEAKIQRCLVHVIRQASAWLTRNPKTIAGKELLEIVEALSRVRTRRQKRRWIRSFRRWSVKHGAFLKERTQMVSGRWWYTHRKLRATASLIRNAIPDLFRFSSRPSVPRTSNHVEGGLNARIKELFRCHRGMSVQKKLVVASWYLALRQGQKPTRNVN